MEESALSLNSAAGHNVASPKVGETLTQSLPGKKRSASDAEICGDPASAGRGELAEDADTGVDAAASSSKRIKVDGPVEDPPKPHGGWNRGITGGGLRTSFAPSTKDKPRKPLLQRASETPLQPPTESSRSSMTRDLDNLVMPPGNPDFSKRPARGSSWQFRFVNWCIQLMTLNQGAKGLQDHALLRDAWEAWLHSQASIPPVTRAAALRAATDTDLDAEKLQDMFSKALGHEFGGLGVGSPAGVEQSGSPHSEQQPSSGTTPEGSKPASHGSPEGKDWTLPPTPSPSDFEIKQKDQRGWEDKFVEWCKTLGQMNGEKIRVNTPRERNRVAESYLKWIGTVEGLSKSKAATARRAAVQYAQDESAQLTVIFSTTSAAAEPPSMESAPTQPGAATPSPPSAAASAGVENASIGPPDEGDAEYREKYFPGIGPDETFCRMCASRSHNSSGCPKTVCRFCCDPGHRSFSCPSRRRCTKCKQSGHVKEDCHEKLALSPGEMECAFCQSHDHMDESCHELWRSFSPNPDTVRKVRSLPISCYCCGRQGHYGPACGLNPQRPKANAFETWSQANCDQYLDPASSEVAVIFSGPGFDARSEEERPDLGKSIVPKRHIIFEEADDDDEAEAFIRAPVQKSTRFGHITFSKNNNGAENRGGRRPSRQYNESHARPNYSLPPLPPGPPPPPPPSRGYQQGGRRNGGRRARGGGRGNY
ncbi:hypothetical protein BT67DRAFT_451917 [Trichocladium antarcticum]|uniref:CCHC-type domain-containing protein n=1 Tax=Trichocladium antarcticum TaxID=1450529 RepID=A0AAN6UGG1_9PEZI|nr:hypothetical protein BT67DRAFT_451917 [Trichocladium antarcticum]